jgi:ubiquinone/menaquinone biosynthesis C-methylase UbiE
VIRTPEDTTASLRTLVYAGRFTDKVSSAELPEGCKVLTDWDVLPYQLAALERATTLVVLDLFSFPFESMTREQWDVPLVVTLPAGFDAPFLSAVFEEAVLGRLGFFDRVATADRDLWEELRLRYRWAGSQRIELHCSPPDEAAAKICGRLEEEAATPISSGEDYETIRYWRGRGDALASSAPQGAIHVAHHDPAFDKAVFRVQSEALGPQFVAARGARAEDVPFEVLEVGVGVGRWASKLDPANTRLTGLDVSESMIQAARADFPEGRFDLLEEDLLFPYAEESFDLAFTVSVLHHNPASAKRTLISEMWRVTRPGGRLMFLEDFVSEKRTPGSTVYPMSIGGFVDLVCEATAGRVVLEHVEALRYPHDPFFRGGLLSLSKVGTPQVW